VLGRRATRFAMAAIVAPSGLQMGYGRVTDELLIFDPPHKYKNHNKNKYL
jgi:hypothetical protein